MGNQHSYVSAFFLASPRFEEVDHLSQIPKTIGELDSNIRLKSTGRVAGDLTMKIGSLGSLPDSGFSPVVLRPDFPASEQADFVAALQAYYTNQHAIAVTAVQKALSNQHSAARLSWCLLDQLLHRFSGQLWSEDVAGQTKWAKLPTEEIVVRIAEIARDTGTTNASAGLDIASDQAIIARRTARAEHLANGLAELLNRIPMPPSAGVMVTDIEIFGRILYHHVMNNRPPVQSSINESLETNEERAFQVLCDYLLAERRLDLLIQVVEFRTATEKSELAYLCKILETAFSASASKYQAAKCQFWRLRLFQNASKSQRRSCGELSPIFDRSGDEVSSVHAQLVALAGMKVEEELQQLQMLRNRIRPAQHYQLMRDLCQREIKLWLGLDTRERFEGLLQALRELELTESRQDCVDGLPSRHENFLSFLTKELSALGSSGSKSLKKLVVCVYMEDVCREGKLPRFAAWWAADSLHDVYKHLLKFDYNETATGFLASKEAFVSLVFMNAAHAAYEGNLDSGIDEFFSAKLSTSWARAYASDLILVAYYSPEQVARQKLLQAQELSRKHMDIALAKGWAKLAYHLAIRGARASIRLRQNLYETVFWPVVRKYGGRSDFEEDLGFQKGKMLELAPGPLEYLPAQYATISRNPYAYWRGPEPAPNRKIEALELWFQQVESAVQNIRGSRVRGPWWDDIVESQL